MLGLDRFIPHRISVASNMVGDVISDAYRTWFGLTVAESRLVTLLAELGCESQFSLGAATRMDKVTVSRAAIALADRDLISRSRNPADKRSHLLSLTPSGRLLHARVAPKALALEKELLADFSPEEVEMLMLMLIRLEHAAAGLPRSAGESTASRPRR